MPTRKKISRIFQFHEMRPDQKLWETTAFKAAIVLPLATSIALMIIAGFNTEGLSVCGRAECFINFYELFKPQLAIASLTIPLGALVAAQLRSIQTVRLIKEQEEKNIFSNFIDHRKLFIDIFEELNLFGDGKSKKTAAKIYKTLFPFSQYGELALSPEVSSMGRRLHELCLEFRKKAEIMDEDGSDLLKIWIQIVHCMALILPDFEITSTPERDDKESHIEWADGAISFIDDFQQAANFFGRSVINLDLDDAKYQLSEGQKALGKPQPISIKI